ncbi:type VI secretion system membrane subunit TssM [Mesorhizobium sp. A623]
MKVWLARIFSIVALAGLSVAVWIAGPLVGFADSRPLAPAWVRLAIIVPVIAAIAGYYAFRFRQGRKASQALEMAVMQPDPGDTQVLETRMSEAIATLKRTSGKRNFLYDIPWYVIIGPPGAGKTTALVNSGLKFPLAGSSEAQPVAGTGGTRNCDWWFTEEAVLIDTAGRYTTQDSDALADRKSWLAFLSILKKYRPRQPINGVILAVSLADLMASESTTLDAHAAEIRNRLREIHENLKIEFPVYMLFTKADLVSGFMEYFASFDEQRRRNVWGATFQTSERGKNTVASAPAEFDALVECVSKETTDRLQAETDATTRIAVFGFAAQFAALRQRIAGFLDSVFDPMASSTKTTLRGFYFSSGTQEGTPIDQLLGALGRSFGNDAGAHLSGTGRSFFLHDLLAKVVFAESGWVSQDKSANRRDAALRVAGFGAIGLVAVAALGTFGMSFLANRSLIASTAQILEQYRGSSEALLKTTTVADTDLENVIGALDTLRNLPAGYATRDLPAPVRETFGLAQRERLVSASQTAYGQALERLFRSRLLLQLEQTIQANIADPAALYEPLKIYLMLGGAASRIDDELIVSWMKRDWEQNRYPGVNNRAGRADLEAHLRAMLALDDEHDPLFGIDKPLVESAQRSLGRMSVADRGYALLYSGMSAGASADFSVASAGGPEAPLVFETTDGSDLSKLAVPGIYTYDGFRDLYLPTLATVAQKVVDDQWVVGAGTEQSGVEQELMRLGPELLDRYGKAFAGAWTAMLDRLKFKPMSADKPQYLALSAAASPNSPIRLLFEAIASQTALTRAQDPAENGMAGTSAQSDEELRKGLARIGIDLFASKSQSRAGAAFANSSDQNPGAAIEAPFRPYQMLVAGPVGQRPVDSLIQNFRDVYQSLLLAASVPTQAQHVNANLQLQISTLRANASRLPRALATMVRLAADDFEGEAAETSIAQLNQQLAETVTQPCEKAISNRYPFAASGEGDVPMTDFAALFAPSGVLDRFFAQNLSPLVDMSGQTWEWKQDTQVGRQLSKSTLRDFQLASEIRDAFFPVGSSGPLLDITFTPFSLNGDADSALLEVNGQAVQSFQTGSMPTTIDWPGSPSSESAGLSLTPELPGRESSLKFEGPWALKRLLDAGSVTRAGDSLEARFVIGGRDVAYTLRINPPGSPFSLPAFSGFSCPTTF